MDHPLLTALRQEKPFSTVEEEAWVGLQVAANRALDPWARWLRANPGLTPNQYNVLRILRGAHPGGLTCAEIGDRTITRDPDVTRLVDRLVKRGLAHRERDVGDRRVVNVSITEAGLAVLRPLDAKVDQMAAQLLGPLGEARLRALAKLLDDTIGSMGRFPGPDAG